MSVSALTYIWLDSDAELAANLPTRPFKVVVVAESAVEDARSEVVSRWLVSSGCAYVMASGACSEKWLAKVTEAYRAGFHGGQVPDDRIVITTSHANEPLSEVFWFAKYSAMHPCFELERTLILHVADVPDEQQMCAAFAAA